MRNRFKPAEWVTVIPRQKRGLFETPYAEPASIVAQETGSDLQECVGCGQLREHVIAVVIGQGTADVCVDCRRKYNL